MSIVNLHKKFVCKIVETGYFAEIPASASDKGRPKNVPHSWTEWGLGLAELTAGGAGSVIAHKQGGGVIAINRTLNNIADLVD